MTQLVIILEFNVDAIKSLMKSKPHETDVDFFLLSLNPLCILLFNSPLFEIELDTPAKKLRMLW